MSHYLRTLSRAIRGVDLVSYEDYVQTRLQHIAKLDAIRKERDEIRSRYEALVAECTRHRHATWEITHQ